jgi:hypothetical protein
MVYERAADATKGIKGSVSVPEFGPGGDYTATKQTDACVKDERNSRLRWE